MCVCVCVCGLELKGSEDTKENTKPPNTVESICMCKWVYTCVRVCT